MYSLNLSITNIIITDAIRIACKNKIRCYPDSMKIYHQYFASLGFIYSFSQLQSPWARKFISESNGYNIRRSSLGKWNHLYITSPRLYPFEALAEISDFVAGLVQRVPKKPSEVNADLQNSTASQGDGSCEDCLASRLWKMVASATGINTRYLCFTPCGWIEKI